MYNTQAYLYVHLISMLIFTCYLYIKGNSFWYICCPNNMKCNCISQSNLLSPLQWHFHILLKERLFWFILLFYSIGHFKRIAIVFNMFPNRNVQDVWDLPIDIGYLKIFSMLYFLQSQFPIILSFLGILPLVNIKPSCALHLPGPFFYF